MIQLSYFWLYIQRKWKQGIEADICTPCSLRHYSQYDKAEVWKQPKCPTTRWLDKKMFCIYICLYLPTEIDGNICRYQWRVLIHVTFSGPSHICCSSVATDSTNYEPCSLLSIYSWKMFAYKCNCVVQTNVVQLLNLCACVCIHTMEFYSAERKKTPWFTIDWEYYTKV